MFSKLLNFRGNKIGHTAVKIKMCVLPLISYDDKTETINYGQQCYTIDVVSLSLSSITIRHNNQLKKGDMLEFRTKHALDDSQCLKCPNFNTLSESPSFSSFIGKIIWKNNEEAGVNIIMMKEQDKAAIAKLIKSSKK